MHVLECSGQPLVVQGRFVISSTASSDSANDNSNDAFLDASTDMILLSAN